LSTSIKRSRAKDITEAYDLDLIDRKEPHKILNRGFQLLSQKERRVASYIAVFRSVFTFESAKALFTGMAEAELWQVMQELCGLGFLFFYEREQRFDFHPIMRSFLYNNLTKRAEVHTLAVQYFQAVPEVEEVITLEDLIPVIELYYHLVKAGKFDEAWELYTNRIWKPAYYQLSAYNLSIELLKKLYPQGEESPPRLGKEFDQGWALNELANSYALSGQPAKAVSLFLKSIFPGDEKNDKKGVAISLGNAAGYAQLPICQLSASTAHLRKKIAISQEIGDEFWEAVGHQELGRVLAYQGRIKVVKISRDSPCSEKEFIKAFDLAGKTNEIQSQGLTLAYRSLAALLQARLAAVLPGEKKHRAEHSLEALEQTRKALNFAEETAKVRYPYSADFIWAYWLLGEALVQCRLSHAGIKPFVIHFYDEPFQQQVESLTLKKSSEIEMAGRCLDEALRRCRKVNLVELEPDILLTLTRLEWVKQKQLSAVIEEFLNEAQEISLRSGYRLKLADLHLFCGQVLLELKEQKKLLGFTAGEHFQKAKEYSLDVSEFSDLYQSPDLHFYDNIPEYEMLKRGMTDEERIKNGYHVAYKIAEALEKNCLNAEMLMNADNYDRL